ncbi:MAG: hypothetical protein AAF465_14505 [Pseudomonadota bacterium]
MRHIGLIIVVALVGIAGWAGYAVGKKTVESSSGRAAHAVVMPNVAPSVDTQARLDEAERARRDAYGDVQSIERVLTLPTDFTQTEALYVVAGRADEVTIRRLIDESSQIAERYDRLAALRILYARFTELNPNGAVQYLLSSGLDIADQIVSVIYGDWARLDLNAAITSANALENVRYRSRASYAILSSASRAGSAPLQRAAAKLVDQQALARIEGEALAIRANRDPMGALADINSLSNLSARYSAMRGVATVWGRTDPVGAIDALNTIQGERLRAQFLQIVVARWVEDDADIAMQYILDHPDPQKRAAMLSHGLATYSKVNPNDALALARDVTGPQRQSALQGVMSEWVARDPMAAQAALMTFDKIDRDAITTAVVQRIAYSHPEQTMAWLETMEADERNRVFVNALPQIAQSNPRRALDFALTQLPETLNAHHVSLILGYSQTNDPAFIQEAVSKLPPGAATDTVYQEAAGRLARADGRAALRWAQSLPSSARVHALKGVATAVSQSDPDLAMSLIYELPEAQTTELIRDIAMRRSTSDPGGTLSWVRQFQHHPQYDEVLTTTLQSIAMQQPEIALNSTEELSPVRRQQVVQTAIGRWARSDPTSAARWAERADDATRTTAVSSVAHSWVRTDVSATARWLRALPDPSARDQAIIQSYQILRRSPQPGAAARFLDESGASSTVRQQLLGG